MKRVLITGANSYIGTSFEKYMEKYSSECAIDTLDLLDPCWEEKSFSGYDAIFHVAGIAHSDSGKISEEKSKLYYAVNTDLTVKVAKKAKEDGAAQFVFMSSAIVYGESAPVGKLKVITADTCVAPANCYGDSKVQAEKGILPLNDDSFKVAVLRPPMIYGPGCKGNYPRLASIALKIPFFPNVQNYRSMIYIENFCEFVRLAIKNGESGIFFPQNEAHVNVSEMVRCIAQSHGKKIRLVKGFSFAMRLAGKFVGSINKAFGNFAYDIDLSEYRENYRVVSFEESIARTEGVLQKENVNV